MHFVKIILILKMRKLKLIEVTEIEVVGGNMASVSIKTVIPINLPS
jgi:hypothetical protein